MTWGALQGLQQPHLPNLSLPQHETLPPTRARRVTLPLVTTAASLKRLVGRRIAHACWSPTDTEATWGDNFTREKSAHVPVVRRCST